MRKENNGNFLFQLKQLSKLNKLFKGIKLVALTAIIASPVVLTGCATRQNIKAPNVMLSNIDYQIDAAAQSAARSLDQLAAIEKEQHPAAVKMPFKGIESPELSEYFSVKYYGPIKPLLRDIAKKMGYHFQAYGKEPSIPVLVNINTTGSTQTVKQILTNVDLQAGTSARIGIYPQQRLITMRYFNHAPTI
tara:strand:+ start:304 stop:876 length:573 start_codon:yes stop_codon:yes gene_type:complete